MHIGEEHHMSDAGMSFLDFSDDAYVSTGVLDGADSGIGDAVRFESTRSLDCSDPGSAEQASALGTIQRDSTGYSEAMIELARETNALRRQLEQVNAEVCSNGIFCTKTGLNSALGRRSEG